MSIKPILFNTGMVRALQAGRKTVTRRVVKDAPNKAGLKPCKTMGFGYGLIAPNSRVYPIKPSYRPGDILYVRETFFEHKSNFYYKADGKHEALAELGITFKWRPSIHMPREAARIFLRVTDVRAERLQDIDFEGCKAEGIWDDYKTESEQYHDALARKAYPVVFAELWDSTIKPADRALYSWEANPWVWVIKFERVSGKEAYNK